MDDKTFSYKVQLELDDKKFMAEASRLASTKLIDPKDQEAFEQIVADQLKLNEEINYYKEALEELSDLKGPQFDDIKAALQSKLDELQGQTDQEEVSTAKSKWEDIGKALKDEAKKKLASIATSAINGIKNVLNDIWSLAKEMMDDIASYSENSSIFSQEATDLKLSYGLSGAQAYAYQQAAKDVGFGSFEGYLENAAFASKETLDRFDKLLESYQKSYNEDKEIAESWQKFQTEWADFKKEMAMSLIDFFMKNKDTIMWLLQTGVDILDCILEVVGWFVDKFDNGSRERSEADRQRSISDIYNSYGAKNTTTNIKIDNSFSGVNPNDRQTLTNAGEMTYRQVISALK